MTRSIIKIAIALLISIAIGGGYALHELRSSTTRDTFIIKNGCWRVNEVMDLKDKYQRARIALVGLFALRESEVLYFVAHEDADGNPLNSKYDYFIEGPAPDARYWSYTVYGHDFFLIQNKLDRYGYNLDDIEYIDVSDNPEMPSNTAGYHQIALSSESKEGNWLPTGDEHQFYINLRMYNPAPSVYNNLSAVELPTIKRIDK